MKRVFFVVGLLSATTCFANSAYFEWSYPGLTSQSFSYQHYDTYRGSDAVSLNALSSSGNYYVSTGSSDDNPAGLNYGTKDPSVRIDSVSHGSDAPRSVYEDGKNYSNWNE